MDIIKFVLCFKTWQNLIDLIKKNMLRVSVTNYLQNEIIYIKISKLDEGFVFESTEDRKSKNKKKALKRNNYFRPLLNS